MKNFRDKKLTIVIILSVLLVGIIAFRIYDNVQSKKNRAAKVSGGAAIGVEVAKVSRQNLTPVIKFSGGLDPFWQAEISSKVDSRIDQLFVDEGDAVQGGQVIAILDNAELQALVEQARGSVYEAKANLEQADVDLNRNKLLLESGAVSLQNLENSKYRRDMAQGNLIAVQGAFDNLSVRLNNTSVVAPRNGIVTKRFVQAGFYSKAGSPIVSVADTTTLLAKASVGEAQIGDVLLGATAEVSVPAFPDKIFTGVISKISPVAAMPARTFTVEIEIPNKEGFLRAGMFANVTVKGKMKTNIITVPQSALVMREDQKTVYVVNADNIIQQKLIVSGYTVDGMVEVISGVQEGETIVVGGQNKVREGAKVIPEKK